MAPDATAEAGGPSGLTSKISIGAPGVGQLECNESGPYSYLGGRLALRFRFWREMSQAEWDAHFVEQLQGWRSLAPSRSGPQ